jgi:hypothetical protein
LSSISLVRPRRRLSLAPTARTLKPSRAEAVNGWPRERATAKRLGLEGFEHDGTMGVSG